jgi:Ca-activated chloride channel homolog
MKSQLAKPLIFVSFLITSLFTIHLLPDNSGTNVIASNDLVSESALHIISPEGESIGFCPLKHTEVKAEVSGFISRVNVTQEFENKSREKIEAVYTFPLPRTAAVDDMTMHIGKRVIKGKILKREEARTVYENAKSRGHVASLLDQERPNIFTQSVANIMPGEKIKISISYVDYLKYEDGLYEFVFPTVVGPRYIPGNATGKQAGGWANDTDQVPDASRITPPVARPGTRSGHDISIQVSIDAGLPLKDVRSTSHDVDITKDNENALVKLRNSNTIPNKDFILRYQVAGKGIEEGVLSHRGDRGGFFSLILQPPARVSEKDVTPKELVFVIDTSGQRDYEPCL